MIIDSFKVIIIRGDKVVYHKLLHDEHRAKFDDETKNMFKRLRSKDRLIITDIMCVDPSGERTRLQSLDFIIGPDVAEEKH
jgi:hypothetical protein